MDISKFLTRRNVTIAVAVLAVLLIGSVAAFEPVTRNLVSSDNFCTYCHLDEEYDPRARMSWTKPMLAAPDGEEIARCVDCHVVEGFAGTFYAWLHYASVTDFFGHFRDLDSERAGVWLPPRAKTTYRVRDRFFAYDSPTCRTCHVLEEMKPKKRRGQKAHELALKKGKTCIECHLNVVHAPVDRRKGAFKKTASAKPPGSKP